jgi:Cysteine rich repeat
MPRFSVSSIPALAWTGLASVSTVLSVASSAQAQVSPQMRGEATALMQVCRGDYDRLCAGVQPGGGRVLACLQNHASQLSATCGQAMPRAQSLKDSAAAAGVMPK